MLVYVVVYGILVLSKPVEKTTYISLVPGFILGPSSDVRVAYPRDRQDPLNPGLTACVRSLPWTEEESDDLNILDAELVDHVLEANSLPKFDMHLYKSSLTKTHVKWLAKCYGISADLHPRVVSEGVTMDVLPNDAIGLYAHHFQQGG
ncbi:hypothetical protein Tco_0111153 [Tanacetum coccineum]